MTQQEIITEIRNLPPGDWEEIKETIDGGQTNETSKPKMTEDEFAKYLFDKGIISSIPNYSELDDEDDDFEPIEVLGEPLSEMIIRERR